MKVNHKPVNIVRKHRDMWLAELVAATHNDDVEKIKIYGKIVLALTVCYWDVCHGKFSGECK